MISRLSQYHIAMPPPPRSMYHHANASPVTGHAPSALVFASAVILGVIAVTMALVLILMAPQTVTVPIAVALGAGLAVSAAFTIGSRWTASRRTRATRPRRNRAGNVAVLAWTMLAAVSVALLALVFVAPSGLSVALSIAGLAGLLVLRFAAMYGNWVPRGTLPPPPADTER